MSKVQNTVFAFALLAIVGVSWMALPFLMLFKLIVRIPALKKDNQVLFFENFPFENSGYQYRAHKWRACFERKNIQVKIKSTNPNRDDFDKNFRNGLSKKALLNNMILRLFQIFQSLPYKNIVVRRELLLFNDYGNLYLEKILLYVHPNAILDFDDDIAASKREPRQISTFGKLLLENPSKFSRSLQLYRRFVVGSSYLKDLLKEKNKTLQENQIVVIPTCLDYDQHQPKTYSTEKEYTTKLGWIGGDHNLQLLKELLPQLEEVNKTHPISLHVIAGKPLDSKASFPVHFKRWTLDSEVDNIKEFDVGLMPLDDGLAAKGKCGFKLLQYMGLGVVPIASAITVNKEIISENGKNGYLVYNFNDWSLELNKVLSNQQNFDSISLQARKRIIEAYTFKSNCTKFTNYVLA